MDVEYGEIVAKGAPLDNVGCKMRNLCRIIEFITGRQQNCFKKNYQEAI